MIIKSVKLRDFRNYENLNLCFDPNINILIGNNAQGKTNILESIYLCSVGKSFRTAKDKEMIRFDRDFFVVKVSAEKSGDPLDVEIAVLKDGSKGIKVDGVKLKKTSELLQHIYCVVFSPEDLKIVKEEPEKRRKFTDKTLSQLKPSYYKAIFDYKKILQQRNALLKETRYNEYVDMPTVWNESLADCGAHIMMHRSEFLKKLAVTCEEYHASITGGSEKSQISYDPDIELCDNFELQKEKILQALSASEYKDRKNGSTSRGPHKDDMCILVDGVDIRKYGSQGQQRTAALSLKLAELSVMKEETGEAPILLLDDVMSELDSFRQNFLIDSLKDVQLFITGTELSADVSNALMRGKIFRVKEGTVSV